MKLAYLVWNPDRNLFIIPYVNHPVTWYGFLFALGFLVGYFLIRKIFTLLLSESLNSESENRILAITLTDRLAFFVGLGCIIGARLGHIFFYQWSYYRHNLIDIFKIWEGGLASHGGVIGILIGLLIFITLSKKQAPRLSFLTVVDALCLPAAFGAGCIRIGNFINQEITGIPTTLPWGVVFQNPLDGIPGIPIHPVQLYESFYYFCVFIFLMIIWKKKKVILGDGELTGWLFLLIFSFRFLIEYLKMPQNEIFDTQGWLTMGQLLSIPFILLGAGLLIRYYFYVRKKR